MERERKSQIFECLRQKTNYKKDNEVELEMNDASSTFKSAAAFGRMTL